MLAEKVLRRSYYILFRYLPASTFQFLGLKTPTQPTLSFFYFLFKAEISTGWYPVLMSPHPLFHLLIGLTPWTQNVAPFYLLVPLFFSKFTFCVFFLVPFHYKPWWVLTLITTEKYLIRLFWDFFWQQNKSKTHHFSSGRLFGEGKKGTPFFTKISQD